MRPLLCRMMGQISANYKSFLAFQVLIALFLTLEPTVSYKLFLIKKICEVQFPLCTFCTSG